MTNKAHLNCADTVSTEPEREREHKESCLQSYNALSDRMGNKIGRRSPLSHANLPAQAATR